MKFSQGGTKAKKQRPFAVSMNVIRCKELSHALGGKGTFDSDKSKGERSANVRATTEKEERARFLAARSEPGRASGGPRGPKKQKNKREKKRESVCYNVS